jgi:hypothetical protein
MVGYEDAILDCLTVGDQAVPLDALEILCAQRRQERLDKEAFNAALASLVAAYEVRRQGTSIKRVQPDVAEIELEAPLLDFLKIEAVKYLKLDPSQCVVENTARGGAYGGGRWSRPDFTLAAIRSWRFDPRRQLDLMTFELKNRAGTNVLAVHEALAHSRFAHFPYLVCPRALREDDRHRIRQECAEHGVGLVTFELSFPGGRRQVANYTFELEAVRHTPDAERVEQYLSERLSSEGQAHLEKVAKG